MKAKLLKKIRSYWTLFYFDEDSDKPDTRLKSTTVRYQGFRTKNGIVLHSFDVTDYESFLYYLASPFYGEFEVYNLIVKHRKRRSTGKRQAYYNKLVTYENQTPSTDS